jgi:prenylcysteine oxidase / farnesylcysteine lyase
MPRLFIRISVLCKLLLASRSHRIAVIGGGISGTFLSKYLLEYDKNCSIEELVIFDPHVTTSTTQERSLLSKNLSNWDEQGSRATSNIIERGTLVEMGAQSSFHRGNHFVMEMIQSDSALNVEERWSLSTGLGIYDGNGDWKFLVTNGSQWWTWTVLMWKYNYDLIMLLRASRRLEYAYDLLSHFLNSQHETTFFENASDMWISLRLGKAVYSTFPEFLDAWGICKSIEDLSWWRRMLPYQRCIREELLTAIVLKYHNQDLSQVNALVGLDSFVAFQKQEYTLVGGNDKIIPSAFHQAQLASLRCQNCNAKSVFRHMPHQISTAVATMDDIKLFSKDQNLGSFHIVILAAPLNVLGIDFFVQSEKDESVLQPMPFDVIDMENHKPEDGERPMMPQSLPDFVSRPYTQVVTTLVSDALLNISHFNIIKSIPCQILMTQRGKISEHGIVSISKISKENGVYQLLSNEELTMQQLRQIFGHKVIKQAEKVWGGKNSGISPDYQGYGWTTGYLLYDAGLGIKGHTKGSALYYTNSIETSLSGMEMSAVSAKSVAKLVAKRLELVKPHNGTRKSHEEL